MLGRAICSADDYFTYGDVYKWSPDKVRFAHDWCKRKCERFMKFGISPVVISNTNTTESEIQPYIDMAKAHGYMVFSVIVENRHGMKSIHSVPDETLEKMRNRFTVKL
jgi:hypothetical protein